MLIAGFRFDHGSKLLRPLHASMRERNVTCRIFADRPEAERFLSQEWPFGPPFPELYVDSRTETGFSSLHAKCVVVDDARALITPANLTNRGQTRNIEVGALVRDPAVCSALERQWTGLVSAGYFRLLT